MAKTICQAGWSSGGATTANNTQYSWLAGTIAFSATETQKQITFRAAGVLSNLYIRIITSNTNASSTFRTRKNAANGGQSVSPGAATTGVFEDTTGTDTITAGDKLCLQSINSLTGTMSVAIISTLFDATTDTVTIFNASTASMTTASTTYYHTANGGIAVLQTTEANVKHRQREAGTMRYLQVFISAARATATTFRSRKNGANGGMSVSITGTGWFEDTSGSDTIAVGDDFNLAYTLGTGVDTLTPQTHGCSFISTTGDGQAVIGESNGVAFSDATTMYAPITGRLFNTTSTEANAQTKARVAFTCSELITLVSQNGVGSASTVDLRVGAASSALTVSVTASTTGLFADSTDSVTLATTDLVDYRIVIPSVTLTPTVTIVYVSMVMSTTTAPVVCTVTGKSIYNKTTTHG